MNKPFQRFACEDKPLKRLIRCITCNTRLKPWVNEMSKPDDPILASAVTAIVGTLRSLPHCNKRRYD